MRKLTALFFFSVLIANTAVAEQASSNEYCIFWGYLNDIAYRYNAFCSNGKNYFKDGFLSVLSSSIRASLRQDVVNEMAQDGLVSLTTVGGFEIFTQESNLSDAQKASLCLVGEGPAVNLSTQIQCTAGVTLTYDESADATMEKSGFSKVFTTQGLSLFEK